MDKRGAAQGPEERGEDELAGQQAPGLYPIGRALRATYDADNHDSLGSDLTSLMLNLARVEPPPPPLAAPPVAQPAAGPLAGPAARVSWLGRLMGRLAPGTRG